MPRHPLTILALAAALAGGSAVYAQVEEVQEGGAFYSVEDDHAIVAGEDKGDAPLVQPDEPPPAPKPEAEAKAPEAKAPKAAQAAKPPPPAAPAAPPKPAVPPEGLSLPAFNATGTWEAYVEEAPGAFRPHAPGAKVIVEQTDGRLVGEELLGGSVLASFDGHLSGETVRGRFARPAESRSDFVTLAYDATLSDDGREMLVTLRGVRGGQDLRIKFVRLDLPPAAKGKAEAKKKPATKQAKRN